MEPEKRCRKGRSGGLQDSTEVKLVMDGEIWKELPRDLQKAIIARLPIAPFLLRWTEISESPKPWLYVRLAGAKNGAMYDPCSKKWHPSNISHLLSRSILCLQASAGGLICGVDAYVSVRSVVVHVGNPLTQTWKVLPEIPDTRCMPRAMGLCVCVWELDRVSLVWKEVDRIPNWLRSEFSHRHGGLMCLSNQRLLMMSPCPMTLMNPIITYDAVSREWSKLPKLVPPGYKRGKLIRGGTVFFPPRFLSP